MKNIKFEVTDKKGNLVKINIREVGKLHAFDNKKKVYSCLVECDTKKGYDTQDESRHKENVTQRKNHV